MTYKTEKNVTEKYLQKRTAVSFLLFLFFLAGGIFAWNKLQQQPKVDGALKPLRKAMDMNEWVFTHIFSSKHLAKTYSKDLAAPKVRVNGDAGLNHDDDTTAWKLKLIRNPGDTLYISLNELKTLPKTEVIFDFKCIEGWSQITNWGGVRFSDFVNKYGLTKQSSMNYAGLETPDKQYYVGIDMASMMHPQTLLCYEMNGKPLPLNQGYPLRLIIPVKYGVKHLKRIGSLYFADNRPRDYWHEQGYDYYCGL